MWGAIIWFAPSVTTNIIPVNKFLGISVDHTKSHARGYILVLRILSKWRPKTVTNLWISRTRSYSPFSNSFSPTLIISYCHMVVKKSWIIFNFICLENVNPNFNRNPRFYSLHFTLRITASMPKKVNCTKLSRQQFSSARLPFFAIRWVAKQLILKSTLAQSNETESEWVVKLANWQHLTSFTVKILWFCINQHPLHITDSIFSVRMQ